jgi:uncharacterized protein YbgA (DUF1722 family)/uncharacterized protein YbbK (DUF523 family)
LSAVSEHDSHARPVVVISRCIDFDACRYNGQVIRASLREELEPHVTFRPICPELEIGLGVPRDPIRLVRNGDRTDLVQPSSGRDLTAAMEGFSERYLAALPEVDGFILKGRSPSCGIRDAKVHPDASSGMVSARGPGKFTEQVLARFPSVAVEDEGRLRNLRIRDHFLTRIFTWAAFRQSLAGRSFNELSRFHARNKLLLTARSQVAQRELGRLVAVGASGRFDELAEAYGRAFAGALARPSRIPANINVLMHALGNLSDRLSADERRDFLASLEAYRAQRVPLSAPLSVLRSWAARFGNEYLAGQSFLAPYPEALARAEAGRRGDVLDRGA